MFSFFVKRFKGQPRFDTVLDLGCGKGQPLGRLSNNAKLSRVIGVDCLKSVKDIYLERCKEVGVNGEFLAKGADASFDDLVGQVDLIFSKAMFWASNKRACIKVLENVGHLLAPNGTILFVESFVKRQYRQENRKQFKCKSCWELDELSQHVIDSKLVEQVGEVRIYDIEPRCYEIVAGNFDCFSILPQPSVVLS